MLINIKEVRKKVKNKLYQYPIFESMLKELQDEKNNCNSNRDINSYIRSKGKVNRNIENIVINNEIIDNKIKEINSWKNLIEDVLKYYEKDNDNKMKFIKYKFFGSFSDDLLISKLHISRTTITRYLEEIYFLSGINAINRGLINVSDDSIEEYKINIINSNFWKNISKKYKIW